MDSTSTKTTKELTHSFDNEEVYLVIKSTGEIVARYICENDIKVVQEDSNVTITDISTKDAIDTYINCTIKIITHNTFNKEFLENDKEINFWDETNQKFGYKDFTDADVKAKRDKELKEINFKAKYLTFKTDIHKITLDPTSKIIPTGSGVSVSDYVFVYSQELIEYLRIHKTAKNLDVVNAKGKSIAVTNVSNFLTLLITTMYNKYTNILKG